MNIDQQQYLQIGQRIREQILQNYAKDSCIATTRATVDALRQVQKDAYALVVRVHVVNSILFEAAAEAGGIYPAYGSPEYPEGGYGIGIGQHTEDPAEGAWQGHLVAIAERRWLLDYSLDQASRPDYGINLGPMAVPVTEQFLRGNATLVYRYNEAYIYYSPVPGDRSYRTSPNWEGETAPVTHTRRVYNRPPNGRHPL